MNKKKHNKAAGMHVVPADTALANKYIDVGFTFIAQSFDVAILWAIEHFSCTMIVWIFLTFYSRKIIKILPIVGERRFWYNCEIKKLGSVAK